MLAAARCLARLSGRICGTAFFVAGVLIIDCLTQLLLLALLARIVFDLPLDLWKTARGKERK